MNTSKGGERINEEGAVEINVEAVDYRKPAGEEEPRPEKVEVTHVVHDDKPDRDTNIIAGAAGKVAEKLQSAKDAVANATTKKGDS